MTPPTKAECFDWSSTYPKGPSTISPAQQRLPLPPPDAFPCPLRRSYPLDPPSVSFLTPLYHPNVDERGRICLDTLSLPPKGCWSPALTLGSLLTTIHQLMAYPNGQDGLVREVADVYNGDRATFNRTAKEWTRQHAMEGRERKHGEGGAEGEGKEEGGQSSEHLGAQSAASTAAVGEKRERTTGSGGSDGVEAVGEGGSVAVTAGQESAAESQAVAGAGENQQAPSSKRSRVE